MSAQGRIFKYHRFERYISGTFPDAKQRTVDGTRTIHPCGRRIYDALIEIVVAMPLQHLGWHTGIMLQAIDDTGHASRQRCTRIRHAESHRVTGADLNRYAALLGHFHQTVCKWYNKSIEIRARDILKMTPWAKSCFDTV